MRVNKTKITIHVHVLLHTNNTTTLQPTKNENTVITLNTEQNQSSRRFCHVPNHNYTINQKCFPNTHAAMYFSDRHICVVMSILKVLYFNYCLLIIKKDVVKM